MKLQAAWLRTVVATAAGLIATLLLWPVLGAASAIAAGWIGFCLVFCLRTLWAIVRMTPEQTREHATEEDPSHVTVTATLSLAALASVAGVGFLLAGTQSDGTVSVEAVLGALVVVSSWVLVHTLFTVRYARLYYQNPNRPGVDFNGDEPDYHDFAYLAFTMGMTYQVSDTTLQTREVRRAALRHALLSYLLGAVVLACTINLVVQLAAQT
ncbi:DUF1345 domain-containing protein [Micropruina sp.]|uniref:DUF1345 domain-containing protein n=1 Tax=Micropruina sp. TaxID=2737536 RepID=UPI0039E728E1